MHHLWSPYPSYIIFPLQLLHAILSLVSKTSQSKLCGILAGDITNLHYNFVVAKPLVLIIRVCNLEKVHLEGGGKKGNFSYLIGKVKHLRKTRYKYWLYTSIIYLYLDLDLY